MRFWSFVLVSLFPATCAFSAFPKNKQRLSWTSLSLQENNDKSLEPNDLDRSSESSTSSSNGLTRRDALTTTVSSLLFGNALLSSTTPSDAAVGTLPEFANSNAIVQGVTIDVADPQQLESMINFFREGFSCNVVRQRKVGTVTDMWLAFGPEQLSIPSDFVMPVSSFGEYGGHASIHIRYDSDLTQPLYKIGNPAPGNSIAYLQVGVPGYRISQMVLNGGNILDAYGIVNVVSPSGLPVRAIVGIHPDPIMLIAINCKDVATSKTFYEQLGFTEQEFPYARPNKGAGQFEPPQPPNSVYMAPSPNCMGVLLLQNKDKKAAVKPNPALRSLNIVYAPKVEEANAGPPTVAFSDPSGIPISFQSATSFEREEKLTKLMNKG